MPITEIRKRNGSVVDFNIDKVRQAMEKAALAVDPNTDLRIFEAIAEHVEEHLESEYADSQVSVEQVQDEVERALMEFELYDIAKAYILYRAEQAKKREDAAPASLHYVGKDGKATSITNESLVKLFKPLEQFGPEIDVKRLAHHAIGNLYQGISEADLRQALVLTARAFIELDPAYTKAAAWLVLNQLAHEVLKTDATNGSYEKAYRASFRTTLESGVASGRLDEKMLSFDIDDLAAYLKLERDGLFDYLGIQVLYDRYFLREEGGNAKQETTQTFWMRVAMGVAMDEGDKKNEIAKKFYDLLSTFRYIPSTPTLFHAGTTFPQLSSCYLNTVEDDLTHIFKVYGDNAQMSKYSGGIGTDWTNIRGTGALIKTTNVGSQGVVPFLKIANDVTVAINRSGKRRGATCVYLETWHYDVEDFLDLRKNTGDDRRRTHDINTANWVPDLFMKRIAEDGPWTLFSPDEVPELHDLYGAAFEKKYVEYEKKAADGKIRLYKTLPAKTLWRKMISMLFETGHPWITFKDPCNVRSPQDHVGVVHNSNLCTEITLNNSADETAVCNLGSINLVRHLKDGKLDKALVEDTVTTAMRLLDNVIDLNFYPTPETKNSNMQHRPVGLGVMGFQDMLYEMNVNFDTEAAVKVADESMELISYYAISGSADLAKEKGAYASFKGSKWDRGIFPVDTLDLLEKERGLKIDVDRSASLDWKPVREKVKKYGLRNSNMMAVAPTSNLANITGCFPCIEPIYKNIYVKSNMSGEFTVVNTYLVNDLKKLGLWNESMLEQLKASDGSVQNLASIPSELRNKYKSVFEIGSDWLVRIAAYRGKWIDQSQSLNIFFNGTSGKALSEVYHLAWRLGVKTTYYLRSLGASSIEKSTVELSKQIAAK